MIPPFPLNKNQSTVNHYLFEDEGGSSLVFINESDSEEEGLGETVMCSLPLLVVLGRTIYNTHMDINFITLKSQLKKKTTQTHDHFFISQGGSHF